MQKWSRSWALDNNLFERRQTTKSRVVSFAKAFADNVVIFALGATALFTGKGRFSLLKIPCLNKIAAGLLVFKAGKTVAHNALGFGGKDYRVNTLDY